MFGKKKQACKIEFFTENEGLMVHKPQPANRFYPDWFKRMKSSHPMPPSQKYPFGLSDDLVLSNVNSTVKRCPGVISFLSEGYIVPLWSDIVVQVRNSAINVMPSNDSVHASLHGKHIHFDTMPQLEGYYHDAVKFTNPWKVKTPKGWSLLITSPFYHMEERYMVLPGIIDSDTYHHMHVNTFFKKAEADHQLRMGSPFIQVIPFKRDELEMEVRVATDGDKKLLKDLRFRSDRFFGKNKAMRDVEE